MEISEVVNTQFVFPGIVVGLVLVCAALVFVFGFKSVEDFPFDKLATVADDRKPAGKKRKVKDKKSQSNGQATVVPETKQKSSESTSTKASVNKAKSAEKSPVKDVPKPSTKQEKKQTKVEPSPAKAALKDTKNIKELNKITDENQKQGKVKDVQKQEKNQQSNKQGKSKGKENVEVKNKKNVEKSKLKSVEKPEEDEGEWEQATSRKDKKNRKPPTSDDENMAGKSVKGEVTIPGKKKKSKITQESPVITESEPLHPPPQEDKSSTPTPAPVVEPISEPQKEVKEKPAKKEKEAKKEKPKPVIEEATVVESPIANVDNESESKTSKKKKKKSAGKDSSDGTTPEVEEKLVAQETAVSVTKTPVSEHKQTKEPVAENAPAFDELGDTWVEAKPQKKASKKKVRKAE